jgi:hypothetical protein
MRKHLHSEGLAEFHESLVDRFWLEAFGDRGEGSGSHQDDPSAGLLEVPHVRQREDHAATALHVAERLLQALIVEVHPAGDALGRDVLQAERLTVVAGVGPQGLF